MRSGVVDPTRKLLSNRFRHGGMIVTQKESSVPTEVVHVLVAVNVPLVGAIAARNEYGMR